MFLEKDFDSIYELLARFPTEQSCIDHLELVLWAGAPVSPLDPRSKVYKCKGNKYKCKNTGKYFNVKTGTIFDNSNIKLQKWFMAIFLLLNHKKGISSHQMARDMGVTQKTAWFMEHRIRFALFDENPEQLSGIVEADETFVGGKNKNRHKDKKVAKCQGRSFKDKTPVLGVLERREFEEVERPHKVIPGKTVKEKIITKQSRVYARAVKDTSAGSIQPHVKHLVEKGSFFMSDEWGAYNGLGTDFFHSVIDHSMGQYADGETTTNTIEGFWTIFKKGTGGIYNAPTPKHLQKFANEFAFRYNTKHLKGYSRLNTYLGSVEKRLSYKQLINETSS